ncbi:MAG: biotin--[acetyl-CoA-carboxylase] ligase [Acidobacteria bacterium]|nr:biotin--[acetyl-CoA-carboxylase] ligase [Acidobacteriota bacterium]
MSDADRRLARIVRVLSEHPTVVISGPKLAEEIGITAAGVWNLIERLRELGVDIAGHHRSGYQLRTVPDLLLPEMLEPLLRGTIFNRQVHHCYRAGSTNTLAIKAAESGAAEGSVFLAEQQTAGRGRGMKRWYSAQSLGIYCSVLLRPKLPPSDVLVLSLAAGLAVESAVRQIEPKLVPDLKWPNDVLLGGKKVAGILTEMSAEATSVRHIVVGIGINVNQTHFPGELGHSATSLRMASGKSCSRVELCAALLKSLDREYRSLLTGSDKGTQIFRRFEQASSSVRGTRVRMEEEGGGWEGISEGLDGRGFLRVRTNEGLRIVHSASLTWERRELSAATHETLK